MGDGIEVINNLEIARVNIPVAVLIWLMIYPMMLQVDFTSIKQVGKKPQGVVWTVIINWAVKPFTMAFFAWIFFSKLYSAWIDPALAGEYIAGAIILGAAPCTAMVFVWSYLTDGDPNYTLVQVSVNDLIILVAFVPIVGLLLGITNIAIPYDTLITSVIIFVVVPLVAGLITQRSKININLQIKNLIKFTIARKLRLTSSRSITERRIRMIFKKFYFYYYKIP